MTSLEKHTKKNQLMIQIIELENQFEEREQQEAAKIAKASETLVKLTEQYNKRCEELSKKEKELKAILAEYEKDRRYVDTGMLVFQEMKDEIRMLSVQVEGQDLNLDLLNKQLSAFDASPTDVGYLKALTQQLKARREKIFLRGSISPDALREDSEENKKRQYETGRKIGKGQSVISVH